MEGNEKNKRTIILNTKNGILFIMVVVYPNGQNSYLFYFQKQRSVPISKMP